MASDQLIVYGEPILVDGMTLTEMQVEAEKVKVKLELQKKLDEYYLNRLYNRLTYIAAATLIFGGFAAGIVALVFSIIKGSMSM